MPRLIEDISNIFSEKFFDRYESERPIMSILFLLMPLLLGFLLVCCLLPRRRHESGCFALKFFLGIGLGFGITSIVSYILLLLGIFARGPQLIVEVGLTFMFAALAWPQVYAADKQWTDIGARLHTASIKRVRLSLLALFGLAVVVSVGVFVVLSNQQPHGEGDAWSIWNLRARFFFRGAGHWTDAFSNALSWSHPDYPLLLPINVARGWQLVGSDTVNIPILLAAAFVIATLGLLMTALILTRNASQGILAGTVLLATPLFVARGASQLADVPLTFYFLASLIVVNLQERFQAARIALLFGLLVGLSAWVKNEGGLFAIAAATLATFILAKGMSRSRLKLMGCFLLGLLPSVLVLLHFKTNFSPPNDLFEHQSFEGVFLNLMNLNRHGLALKTFIGGVVQFGAWPAHLPLSLLFYAYLVGVRRQMLCRSVIVAFVLLGVMLSGYYAIYVSTSKNIELHIGTSLQRLLLQLWPSLLFLFFTLVHTPEEIDRVRENRRISPEGVKDRREVGDCV